MQAENLLQLKNTQVYRRHTTWPYYIMAIVFIANKKKFNFGKTSSNFENTTGLAASPLFVSLQCVFKS